MAINNINTQVFCNTAQSNEQQILFNEICPKLCARINTYLGLTGSTAFTGSIGSGETNPDVVANEIINDINMVVEFFNISQVQAIAKLYYECTQGQYSISGCKVRPETSTFWQEVTQQTLSNEAGLKIPFIQIVLSTGLGVVSSTGFVGGINSSNDR
tara:strand:- start:473 stop:943 length:471 start_codon:yes stop_codon:yes gene_type:complete